MPEFDYLVGGHKIRLPEGHALPDYQKRYKRYDFTLGELARIVSEKHPGSPRIDIGANIGDSWALMNRHVIAETLLIEGDPAYTKLLKFNVDRLGHPAQICEVFCGTESGVVSEESIKRTGAGTSSINKTTALADDSTVPVLTLREILDLHPDFRLSKLIKLDTDGYDFDIIEANAALFSEMQATIYYECAPFVQENGLKASIKSFQELIKFFKFFVIYDNFGHFLCSLEGDNLFDRYLELMVFLASNRADGAAIYYFDIAAFTPDNKDLFAILKDFETSRFFTRTKIASQISTTR
jgi:FkbM family methyltransferase